MNSENIPKLIEALKKIDKDKKKEEIMKIVDHHSENVDMHIPNEEKINELFKERSFTDFYN